MTAENPRSPVPGEDRPALPDLDIDALVLRIVGDTKQRVDVRSIVQRASLSRTITGASTIELDLLDEDRSLLRSGTLTRSIEVEVGGLWWRMTHVGKTGDTLSLTLEERAVAVLRGNTRPRKASRGKMTRAQFAQSMVAESKRYPLTFWAPELTKKQPIAKDRKARDEKRQPGVDSAAGLTVKGKRADRAQVRNMDEVLTVAADMKAGPKAVKALVAACIVESLFKNLSSGDRDSIGILQVRVGIHGRATAASIEKSVRKFLSSGFTGQGGAIELARRNPGRSAGWVAQQVQGSAFPARYDEVSAEADKIIEAFGGTSGSRSRTYYQRYEFSRGEPGGEKGESSWDALQRLASEVGWVCFVVADTVFFIAEEDLFRGRSRATLTETDGVQIDFDRETNRRLASEATVTLDADVWAAPPGSTVRIEGCGPADGRWLVEDIKREDLFDPRTVITLRRPAEELPEPRSTERTEASGAGGGNAGDTYPLRGTRGKLIGVPYQGTHTLGNWQSDNAVDLGVPNGTIIQAVGDGVIERVKGSYSGGASRFDGIQITLRLTGGNRVWYTHLSKSSVTEGARVKAGDAIGRSGSANGVPHLHMGVEKGDPRNLIGLKK